MNGNIYITGFMGAGKSTVGRTMADMLGRRFVDLDDLLEKRFKKSIAKVFDELGESVFREKEKAELNSLARADSLVVATGGGVVLDEDNRRVMTESGTVVWLKTSLDECRKRTRSQKGLRPLWRDDKKISRLFNQRQKLYAMADLTVDTSGLAPDAVTKAIVAALLPIARPAHAEIIFDNLSSPQVGLTAGSGGWSAQSFVVGSDDMELDWLDVTLLPHSGSGTFSVRLYGNMMSGTMIVAILLTIVPLFFPIVMQLLGLITGVIQAYIFAILATIFIASATRAHQRKGE